MFTFIDWQLLKDSLCSTVSDITESCNAIGCLRALCVRNSVVGFCYITYILVGVIPNIISSKIFEYGSGEQNQTYSMSKINCLALKLFRK